MFFSCKSGDINRQLQRDYSKVIQHFKPELVSHFPEKLEKGYWYRTTIPHIDTLKLIGFGEDKLFLITEPQHENYNSTLAELKNQYLDVYSTDDSSLLLVFSYANTFRIEGQVFRNQESPEMQAVAKHNVTKASSLPVPRFDLEIFESNTRSGLTEDFRILVIDAKPGKYLQEKYLEECECLPEKWKHGYSKGIAYSLAKKVIIYWLIVW